MHGAGHVSDDEPMADMNFIPLIDIALTLVIILMVTTVFAKQPGVTMRLPQTATRDGEPEKRQDVKIAIGPDGKFYLDGQAMEPPAMQAQLMQVAKADKNTRIHIMGDREVPYARVMEAIDIVRQAGLTRLVLPTDPKRPQNPAPAPGA